MMTLEAPTETTFEPPTLVTRFATEADLLRLTEAFKAMLEELEPFGHDILPTHRNVAWFGANVFMPALRSGQHAIVISYEDDSPILPIACIFCVPAKSPLLNLPANRAVNYGIWVAPAHRRQGLALMLQDMAHARLAALGYTTLISTVLRDNEAGLAAARKAGAEITGYITTIQLGGKQ